MKRQALVTLVLATQLGGCATMAPGTGAGITYAMPRTDAIVTLNLLLTSCSPLGAEGVVTVTPAAGAQTQTYRISGDDLASARVRRSIKIGVNTSGAITQVNASASDRTAQIAAGVVKTTVTLAPMMALTGPRPPECRPEVAAALARAARLEGQIRNIRAELGEPFTGSGRDLPDRRQQRLAEALPGLITELATLKTDILHLSLSGRAVLDPVATRGNAFATTTGTVALQASELAKWYQGTDAQLTAAFGNRLTFAWSAERLSSTPIQISSWGSGIEGVAAGITEGGTQTVKACDLGMPIPTPARVRVTVTPPTGIDFANSIPPFTVHAAQWNQPASLCLNAAFGETRSAELTFDDFGRTTAFAWVSEARAEALSTVAAGAAADVVGYWRSQTDVVQQQSEALALETQQKLNRLRACEAILAAGGYTCPP